MAAKETELIQATEPIAGTQPKSSKDERDFRPGSLKEIYEHTHYKPFKVAYTKTTGEVVDFYPGCWLSCEDIGIIASCFIMLWATLLGLYALLLKAALDTDEKSTALWIFFVLGVIFVIFIAGSVFMNSVEQNLKAKYSPESLDEQQA